MQQWQQSPLAHGRTACCASALTRHEFCSALTSPVQWPPTLGARPTPALDLSWRSACWALARATACSSGILNHGMSSGCLRVIPHLNTGASFDGCWSWVCQSACRLNLATATRDKRRGGAPRHLSEDPNASGCQRTSCISAGTSFSGEANTCAMFCQLDCCPNNLGNRRCDVWRSHN